MANVIVSDDSGVEASIKKLISIIKKNGGYVNFYLEFHCRAGQLSVHASNNGIINQYILRIPHKCLVPVDELDFGLDGGVLAVKSMSNKITPVQSEIVSLILDIYNRTNKIGSFENVCLLKKEENYHDLISLLYSVRGFDKYRNITITSSGNDRELIDAFFNTRGYGIVDSAESTDNRNVMVPLIDLLNHNLHGAPFRNDMLCQVKGKKAPLLSVRASCPVPGSNECYAYYGGIYDTYDLFLIYQYVDQYIPYVRSIPVVVDLGQFGTIVICTEIVLT